VRDQYFETAFSSFGHLTVPDVSSGDFKVTNIRVDMDNGSPDNLKVSFQKDTNSIGVEIDQTHLVVNVDWKYSKSIISIGGSAEIDGTIGGIAMGIAMSTAPADQMFVPQIGINGFILNLDKGAFNLDFHCDNCPGEVEKLISDYLKDQLIDQVQAQIQAQVPTQMTAVGNQILQNSYPKIFNLYNNIDIATGLVASIIVNDDYLSLPLDGTIFLDSEGYNRPGITPDMPSYNPKDPGEIMMFFNEYLVDTLTTTLNKESQTYQGTILGFAFQASLDPSVAQTILTFEEGDFNIKATPKITFTSLKLGFELGAIAKINPKILKGDATNMFSIVPQVKGLSLTSLKVFILGIPINLSFGISLLNPLIQMLLNMAVVPTIAIPKLQIMPLHVTDSELDFHNSYSEFGILFDFGQE
jgi:hypothetical protein